MYDTKFVKFLSKNLIFAALSAIVLIGLCVITGWHAHVSTLIQIIPGTIPMQYNTALCLIVLAASAGALVTPRVPRFMGTAGGALVCLAGALVVFQYAAGMTLGIDTLFFYPWDQTLSADPGRMALTTGICFALSGASLSLLLVWPQRALIVFVLAHTFPLSFGLTSLLGYLFGIKYVLPFNLGSQMAIHTAAAFTIYGAAMLFYAWQKVPQTAEELPRWTPGVAVVMVPVFFVSLGTLISNDSAAGRFGQLLLAMAGAALLALTLHKLMQARILYKGLILISIPLLFVLGFVVLVNQQKIENEKVQALVLHSKEVISQTHTLSEQLVEAESALRGYVISKNDIYRAAYEAVAKRIPEESQRIEELVADNAEQTENARQMTLVALERIRVLNISKKLVDENREPELAARIRDNAGKNMMADFQDRRKIFLDGENRLDEARQQAAAASWQKFDWLLVSGAAADLLLALTLAFLFTRGIGRRLQVLTENSRALAAGGDLAQPLAGTDEVAAVDRTFHRMARALRKSQAELETKVEERTEELSRATAEIIKINETLEQRVADRTDELEAANKELEAFSYSVSHDLRAPLRAIDGFSRILLEDYAEVLDDEGRRVIDVVCSNARNMGALIDDLLAFSRLGRKPIEPTIVDMEQLAHDVCEQLEPNAQPLENLTIEKLPDISGDRALLRQVFVNLVSNAVKYSRTRENAPVEIGGRREQNENVYYIKDQGVGFDMKYAGKLFGVFQRLHSAEEFEGTGVGLAIVQRIVQRHGGRVWAEGEVNRGATFYFALPRDYV